MPFKYLKTSSKPFFTSSDQYMPNRKSGAKYLQTVILFLIFTLCSFSHVSAKSTFHLNWEKSGNYFKNTLLVKDLDSDNTSTLKLPSSYKFHGDLYYQPGAKYLVYYYRSTKNQAHLVIIEAKEPKINHELDIDPLNFSFDDSKRTRHWFLSFNQDLSEFLIFVGKGKKQTLLAIDLSSGKLVKNYPIGRGATKISTSQNRRYFWVEKINLRNKPIKVFDTIGHKVLQSLEVDSRQPQVQSIDDLLFIQHKVKLNKKSSTETHQIIVLDMSNNKIIHNFNSSYPTLVYNTGTKDGIYLLGRSFGRSKNFMFHQIDLSNEVIDWSQPNLDFKPLWVKLKTIGEESYLYGTGDHKVMRMNLNNKSSFKTIPIPDKSDNAILNADGSRLYYSQATGSNVGLVDFSNEELVKVEKTGRSDVKFGQFIGTFISAALTAPSGVSIYPTNGLSFSKNFLMLSNNEKWLFAMNAKTNDVTIFNAKDMSEKQIIATGKDTFQMLQGTNSSNLPVALLSNEMISFVDTDTGQLTMQIKYDQIIEIRATSLTVEIDDKAKIISLTHPVSAD